MSDKNIPLRRESLVMNSSTFGEFTGIQYDEAMTVRGAVNKTGLLVSIAIVSAALAWIGVALTTAAGGHPLWVGVVALAALAVGIYSSLNREAARYSAPLYALLEGGLLGGLSAVVNAAYPGIVVHAVLLTIGTLCGLLFLYTASGFQVTAKFRAGILAATIAICLVYLANLVLHLVGFDGLPFIHQTGWAGIGFNLYVVMIAAVNLVLDFDLIESGAREGAPNYMEWYCAFGLLVTLIWLYLEVLEMLIRIYASSDDD